MKKFLVLLILLPVLTFYAGCKENANNGNEGDSDMQTISFSADYFIGKKAVVYGDSITYGVGTSDKSKGYIDLLSKQIGFSYDNFAVSGSLLTYVNAKQDGRKSGVEIITEHKEYNEKADYALIMYGANDSTHRVIYKTDYDTEPKKLEDVGTYKQGIEYAVKVLRDHNPDIKIVFLTPILRTDNNGYSIEILKKYTEVIKNSSKELDYYYVDNYSLFSAEEFGENSEYTSDCCHPNDVGNRKIYEHLLNKELIQG